MTRYTFILALLGWTVNFLNYFLRFFKQNYIISCFSFLPLNPLYIPISLLFLNFIASSIAAISKYISIACSICILVCVYWITNGGSLSWGRLFLLLSAFLNCSYTSVCMLVSSLFRECQWDFMHVAPDIPRRDCLSARSPSLWLLPSFQPFSHKVPWDVRISSSCDLFILVMREWLVSFATSCSAMVTLPSTRNWKLSWLPIRYNC